MPISERSVGNLVDDYIALCECVAGDTGRELLKRQRGIVFCVDGVAEALARGVANSPAR